ncbi:MAG TPA: ZIP family metal transporter [bacterium]
MEANLYLLIIVLTALLGTSIPFLIKPSGQGFLIFLYLSGGVLLGVAFFHMLPESIEITGPKASYFILLGILLLFGIERFATIHPCELEECEEHTIGIPAFIGFSLHNFMDGIALGASMHVIDLTFMIFFAIMLHKFPMSFALTTFLLKEGFKRHTAMFMNIAFVSMIPLGTYFAYRFLPDSKPELIAYALAFSAGSFIYISLGDIVPGLHRPNQPKLLSTLSLLLGISIMSVSKLIYK